MWFFLVILLLLAGLTIYVRHVAEIEEPPVSEGNEILNLPITQPDSGLYYLGKNWFRKSESGLYELYVTGDAFERGVANGRLTSELVQYQEQVFTNQINQFVPSSGYRSMLKYMIGWFNRDITEHVPMEYQQEIFGVSRAASSEYDFIAPAYQRILNYHAAHDIGHALQNMSLVGCTSFALWNEQTADSSLLIGRNFDFYVGDEFARDKIIAFYNPNEGHKFMMVTFGGMTGVLSGMNDQGLTVTINAAKSEIPTGSATPVSLVAREILQHASTIQEANAIAWKRKMFVAESFLIGSAKDGKAAVIEKTPDEQVLFEEDKHGRIVCTNHFQSHVLGGSELNNEHVRTSASMPRWKRVQELLDRRERKDVRDVASVLRNQNGLNDKMIGLGNEQAINQLVAHHAVIFQPEKQLVWVSTSNWQLGKFVCYDLKKVFNLNLTANQEIYEQGLTIPADSFLLTPEFIEYKKFSQFRFPFQPRGEMNGDSLVKWNPESYHAYMLAGDAALEKKNYKAARSFYETGLTKEVATEQEREHMEKNLKVSLEKIND